jgi:hypothetical protein
MPGTVRFPICIIHTMPVSDLAARLPGRIALALEPDVIWIVDVAGGNRAQDDRNEENYSENYSHPAPLPRCHSNVISATSRY